MQKERLGSGPLRFKDPRRDAMLEPEEVSAILRLNELGWGAKRIARELGISRNTAKDYIAAGGWTPYRQPQRRKALDGQEAWLRERLRRHRGNADVIRPQIFPAATYPRGEPSTQLRFASVAGNTQAIVLVRAASNNSRLH